MTLPAESDRDRLLAAVPPRACTEFYSRGIIAITHRSLRREFLSVLEAIDWADVLRQQEARR